MSVKKDVSNSTDTSSFLAFVLNSNPNVTQSNPNRTPISANNAPDDFNSSPHTPSIPPSPTKMFKVVYNRPGHMSEEELTWLVDVKNLFARQLPKMPREYITRLVFDCEHKCMCLLEDDKVIGGICYRPFLEQSFAEIVFCAIMSSEQVKGYGSLLMNSLKAHVFQERIYHFLTYADNFAIGYFKKQGFHKQITLDKSSYFSYIKHYDGGLLMQCVLSPNVDHLNFSHIINQQRNAVIRRIKQRSKSHRVHQGIPQHVFDANEKGLALSDIPGVFEAGLIDHTSITMDGASTTTISNGLSKEAGLAMVKAVIDHPSSWPFLLPVDPDEVPSYYGIIKVPMDLSTIKQKLIENLYTSKEQFADDFKLMCDNCRLFNDVNTQYYKCAEIIEKFALARFELV